MPKSRIIKIKFESNRPAGQQVRRPITNVKKTYAAAQKPITVKG